MRFCALVTLVTLQTPYWIEPDIASRIVVVATAPALSWIQLDSQGDEGAVTPVLYQVGGDGKAVQLCSIPLLEGASVTALLAVTADSVLYQAAFPHPTDRTLFSASIAGLTCSVPVIIPLPIYGGSESDKVTHSSLRQGPRDPASSMIPDRIWTSANVNRDANFAIVSIQWPSQPAMVLLMAVCCTVPAWSPLQLLSNQKLADTVATLPVPTAEFITVPSAQTGVVLNGIMFKPRDFSAAKHYPALMYVFLLC